MRLSLPARRRRARPAGFEAPLDRMCEWSKSEFKNMDGGWNLLVYWQGGFPDVGIYEVK
jgi:hypothetical protein